ncbi:MAG: TetR/AcrR family transcriptional regulator [Eubacterium sp.]
MAKKDGTLDLRIKRTQKAIKESFFILVEEKGFEHISVKDITDRAMISRNTFYLHYEDKYDLLNKICDDLMRKLFFGVGKQLRREQKLNVDIDSAARIMKIGNSIIAEDKDAYRILLTSSGSDLIIKKIQDIIRRAIDLIKNDIEGISDFSIEYIVSGMTGLIKYQVTRSNDAPEVDFYSFASLHLGNIIDSINKKKAGR